MANVVVWCCSMVNHVAVACASGAQNLYSALLKNCKARGGESGGAGVQGGRGFLGGKSPKKARFTVGIDHEGAYLKATDTGMYGPAFFVLKGE